MRFLLDTHIFLWVVKDDRRLNKIAKNKILQGTEIYVSSASIWEIAIKSKLKKVEVDVDQLINAIAESDFLELPVKVQHAAAIMQLPDIHRDPFDRILIAQAISEPLTFLTADTELRKYSDLVEFVG